ncbi:MAG: hypothetical protein AAFU71_11010 [Cyanobacteria bacterium J06632_22]
MNSNSDKYRDVLDWLWQLATTQSLASTLTKSSEDSQTAQQLFGLSSVAESPMEQSAHDSQRLVSTPPEDRASEVGVNAVSSKFLDPLESEDWLKDALGSSPQFSVPAISALLTRPAPPETAPEMALETAPKTAPKTAQSFNFGEISPVQDRFHTLLKNRLRLEFENRPDVLFPWESAVHEYPVELPSVASAAAGTRMWMDNLRQLRVASALPEAVLARLLEGCQSMARSTQQQGVKLIRTVESLFPNDTDLLEPIAGIVLTPAYRSADDARASAIQELESLANDYDAATTEQQIAISMLAAQEIMAALTLTVSETTPQLSREWVTTQGLLKLEVKYDSDLLFVRVYCPGNSRVTLKGDETDLQATRTQPGRLELVKAAPTIGNTYSLEVSLPDSGSRALRFSLAVLEDDLENSALG